MRRSSNVSSAAASSPPTVSMRRKSLSPAATSTGGGASSPPPPSSTTTTTPVARRPSQVYSSPIGLPPTAPATTNKSPSPSGGGSAAASPQVFRTPLSLTPAASSSNLSQSSRRPAAAVVILDDVQHAAAASPQPAAAAAAASSPPQSSQHSSPAASILIARSASPPAPAGGLTQQLSSSSLRGSAENSSVSTAGAHFTEQETRYFRKMFGMFDTDHSGAIGFFEMKNLARHLGVQISDEQLRISIDRVDDNGNGELEFEEFLQWLANVNDNTDGEGDEFAVLKSKIRAQGARPLTTRQIEQFRTVFHHFDTDESGTIDVEELGNVFEAMGQSLTTEELQSILKHADDDGSGEIDFDEFLMLMCCNFGAEESFEGDLMETFRRYDVDADGLISTRDLRQLVVELVGDSMTGAEVDEVVEVAAVERGDGYIEYMKWESLWDACRGIV